MFVSCRICREFREWWRRGKSELGCPIFAVQALHRRNSARLEVTTVKFLQRHCPAIKVSYDPMVFPVRANSARISPATRASSASNGKISTGPLKNFNRRSVFSCRRTLLNTPNHSSQTTREDSAIVLSRATALVKPRAIWTELSRKRAMHVLVSRRRVIRTYPAPVQVAAAVLQP